jgi:hypothetical protein
MVDGRRRDQPRRPGREEVHFVAERHPCRVGLVGRHPDSVGPDRFTRQLHPLPESQGHYLSEVDRLAREAYRLLHRHRSRGGETDASTVKDPNPDPDLGVVERSLQGPVPDGQVLSPDSFDPHLGVVAAELTGPPERCLGNTVQGQFQETLVESGHL